MYKQLSQKFGNIVTVRIFDRMIDRETMQMSRLLEKSIAESKNGKIRLIISIESHGAVRSPESLYESLHFARLHADNIDRMAIIGTKAWERTFVGLFGLFGGIQMEYFDRSEIAKALQWLSQP